MRKLSVLAAALLVAPAVSQAATLEDLLVEKGVITKAEAAAAGGASGKVYYNGGTRFDFPDSGFTMKVNLTLQERYTFTDNDDGIENTSSFSTEKARLAISGTALNEEFSYYVKTDFIGGENADGSKSHELQDAHITWHACDAAWVRMGQWKTGIGRQFVNGDETAQFAEKAIATDEFALGRQQGLGVGGDMDSLSWMAAVYNGHSVGEGQNAEGVDTNHTAVVNLRYSMGEIDPKVEGDIDNTGDHAFTVGAAYAYEENDVGAVDEAEVDTMNVDVMYKYQGFSLAAEYFDRTVDTGSDVDTDGFYAQAGYFLNEDWELAARYSMISYDDSEELDESSEWAGGVNYYWWKHQMKAQINYYALTDEDQSGNEVNTDKWMLQLSSWF